MEKNDEDKLHQGIPHIDWPDVHFVNNALPHLLVVEDNDELRKFLKNSLLEYEVITASNGEDGLRDAIRYVPDVIITDWMMPGKTGIALCKELKSEQATSHIPIIMLTAKAGLEPKLEGLETGADDYLTKPFEMQELKARLKNLIAQRDLLRNKFSRTGVHYTNVKVSSVDDKFISMFYSVLEENISMSSLTVESLSREIGMSRVQLHRKLSALFGHSASDLIRDYRLERAAELLRKKSGNVSEIAFQVGFENLSYFTKAFKQKFEVTPSEYSGS
jgi:DNA-binding response OmpR family regulator